MRVPLTAVPIMGSVVKEGQGGPHRVPHSRSKGGVPSGMQPVRPALPSISSSTRLHEQFPAMSAENRRESRNA